MRGYHYTTWETWLKIRETGLQLALLEERHRVTCDIVWEYVKDGCIWLYREPHQDEQLIGMIFYVSIRHRDNLIVCLEVEYGEEQAASFHAFRDMNDPLAKINLTHDLDAGPYGHRYSCFELLLTPVEPEKVRLFGWWDILNLIPEEQAT
jgi:hypothetical protein